MIVPIKGLKVTAVLPSAALPADIVPAEPAPAGEVQIDLCAEGSGLVVRARLNGKSVRKALKIAAAEGVDQTLIVIQGELGAPAGPGEPLTLERAGLTAQTRSPKPAPGPAPEP